MHYNLSIHSCRNILLNPVVSLFFPNAEKLNERDGENPSQLLKLMRAYYETVYPDKEVTMLEVEKDGFGCYTIQTVVMDHSGVTTRGIGGAAYSGNGYEVGTIVCRI